MALNLEYSMLDNCLSFIKQAADNAVMAQNDIDKWPFAILNLVQAVELSLKEALFRIHPVLIFDNINQPKHTISATTALVRLENPYISKLKLEEHQKTKFKKAIGLRNQIIHFQFNLTKDQAISRFSEVFAFLVYFLGRHLDIEIDEVIPIEQFTTLIEVEKCFHELKVKAIQRIQEENISPEWVLPCPYCGEETFVVEDNRNVCFLCRETAETSECPQCGMLCLSSEMIDFSHLIDSDYDEGQEQIYNNYGYSDFYACPDCIEKVREDIEQQRAEEHYSWMETTYWNRNN